MQGEIEENPMLKVLGGKIVFPPPIWMMRQAGRYLTEYREARAKAGGFLDLCLDPDLAAEVTLQPIRRFRFDAAIIFSDILIVPYALGAKLWFAEGEGPRLEPVASESALEKLATALDPEITSRVYEALAKVRKELGSQTALIGFCGAPWTVASYLVAGRGTPNQAPARWLAENNPNLFAAIIERLVNATAAHLIGQLRAGADLVQLFDTWAGILDDEGFEHWCLRPTVEILRQVRKAVPEAKFILFPKGISLANMQRIVESCRPAALGIDHHVPCKAAIEAIGDSAAIQGNLDPDILIRGGDPLDRAVDEILSDFRGSRHIFNLGHGIKPETPVEHVEQMLARVRSG